MSVHRYKRAPIVEAVVELRFEGQISDKELNDIAKRLTPSFTNQADLKHREVHIELSETLDASVGHRLDQSEQPRKRLSDADGVRAVILAPDSFAVSRLPPYEGFDGLREDIELVWDATRKISGFRKIVQVGMRYINRLDLPFEERTIVRFEDYLNLHIKIPERYETIGRYSLVFELFLPEILSFAKVRSSIAEPALIDRASFLLDIDITRVRDIPQKKEEIFSLLDGMRNAKNEMFEEFITDKARELFDAG